MIKLKYTYKKGADFMKNSKIIFTGVRTAELCDYHDFPMGTVFDWRDIQ